MPIVNGDYIITALCHYDRDGLVIVLIYGSDKVQRIYYNEHKQKPINIGLLKAHAGIDSFKA